MRHVLAFIALLLSVASVACSSPNGGEWTGTFEGHVRGTMDFSIDRRGTKLEGKMTGETVEGEPFRASLEGRIRGADYRATFEGRARNGIHFKGIMRGTIAQGTGKGNWEATLYSPLARGRSGEVSGHWEARQTK